MVHTGSLFCVIEMPSRVTENGKNPLMFLIESCKWEFSLKDASKYSLIDRWMGRSCNIRNSTNKKMTMKEKIAAILFIIDLWCKSQSLFDFRHFRK